MASLISDLIVPVRAQLNEPVAKFWVDTELVTLMSTGIRDLWRSIADLKQEHFLTVNTTDVSFAANSTTLSGVPTDVHKIYLVEPRDLTVNGANSGLSFEVRDFNSDIFRAARSRDAIDPQNDVIYYAPQKQGGPVNAPTIYAAPKVTSAVLLTFCYVPTLGTFTVDSTVPIPGESDNALIAWTIAFARAKEREDRSPDPGWLAIYASEKQNILQSLGLRDYQDNTFVEGLFEDYW